MLLGKPQSPKGWSSPGPCSAQVVLLSAAEPSQSFGHLEELLWRGLIAFWEPGRQGWLSVSTGIKAGRDSAAIPRGLG